ncbi:MAG: hypothetical protein EKK40_17220 [Bradyrhizobiaceae bacterium]|nr:MAG: hypothetical protein EKK40_17220 [Bradyrhizobiaceae bacterium]
MTLLRDKKTLPVFVAINGAWSPLADIGSVPSRAILNLGVQFRNDGVHLEDFTKRMTPDEFLREFGGFTYTVTIDGDTKTWSFTIDDLRKQLNEQMKRANEERLQDPLNRPQVKRRAA